MSADTEPRPESYEDADHIKSPVDSGVTLCGQPSWRVLNVLGFDDPRPNEADGCWTCIEKAKNIDDALGAWLDAR